MHRLVKRIVPAFALLALGFCILLPGGCKKENKDPNRALTLTLDWVPEPEFGGFYQAKHVSHAFRKQEVNIELKSAGPGAPTWQLVANGQTDFATTSADQVMIARS